MGRVQTTIPVKRRASGTAGRWRWARWHGAWWRGPLRALAEIGLTVAALWWLSGTPARLARSPRFGLRALEVRGHQVLTGAQILAATGLRAGENIFAVDVAAVAARVEALPWVRVAVVRRRPPDRLEVRVVERRRIAWVQAREVLGVDAAGVLLPAGRDGAASLAELDLPVVSGLGLEAGDLTAGTRVDDADLLSLLEWWQAVGRADPEFGGNVSEIQPLGSDAVRLLLVGDGLEVRMPRDRVEYRIRMLRELMRRVYRECSAPAYIDMRFAGQVVVGSKERNS